jgi:hypothetical protein
VFDNVEEASTIQNFWPAGTRGAIIVTSQNSQLVHLTQDDIDLQPMPSKEGSALIQRYLRRGGSEQAAAEGLSKELGGLPLAISHFAGYVANSRCTIEQISESYRQRYKSSQIWIASPTASTSGYAHTLATVWDLTWRRLSSDARKLLELMAFLNPDSMPERLFIGPGFDNQASEQIERQVWKFWDIHR